jgi:hypothetical protein
VRIPIPLVILLALAVIAGVWSYGTLHKDFVTPPSPEKIALIKAKTAALFPEADRPRKVISVLTAPVITAKATAKVAPQPEIDLGDLTETPTLAYYKQRAANGTAEMIILASALEAKGQFQRALLAWERVLDITKPDASQAKVAISAIKRLRPTLPDWNTVPQKAIPITIEASTGKKMAKNLSSVLKEVTIDIQKASAGQLAVSVKMNVGKSNAKGASPVALWLAGSGKKPTTTEVISFTADPSDELHDAVLKSIFQLVSSFLKKSTSYTEPAALSDKENPMDALSFRITRLGWEEFASSLNLPGKKETVRKKQP